jgi:hypothetical protein
MHVSIEGLEAHVERVVEEKLAAALAEREPDGWLTSTEAAIYLGIAPHAARPLLGREAPAPRAEGLAAQVPAIRPRRVRRGAAVVVSRITPKGLVVLPPGADDVSTDKWLRASLSRDFCGVPEAALDEDTDQLLLVLG